MHAPFAVPMKRKLSIIFLVTLQRSLEIFIGYENNTTCDITLHNARLLEKIDLFASQTIAHKRGGPMIERLQSHHDSIAGFCYCLHFVIFCQKLKIMSKSDCLLPYQ